MKSTRHYLKSPHQQRGVAAIETALVLPIFILIFFSVIELVWVMHVRSTMIDAAREGARYAALQDVTAPMVQDRVVEVLNNMKLNGDNICPSGQCVTVTPVDPENAKRGDPISVQVDIPASSVSLIPKNKFVSWGETTLSVDVTMAKED